MFNILSMITMPGPAEWVIILIIALIIFGPGKLPDVGKGIGSALREFRKSSHGVNDETNKMIAEKEK